MMGNDTEPSKQEIGKISGKTWGLGSRCLSPGGSRLGGSYGEVLRGEAVVISGRNANKNRLLASAKLFQDDRYTEGRCYAQGWGPLLHICLGRLATRAPFAAAAPHTTAAYTFARGRAAAGPGE
jgi:hypothetical protein